MVKYKGQKKSKQAEAKVVISSSFVEVEVGAEVGVAVEVGVSRLTLL